VVRAATAYGADVLVLEEVTPANLNGLVRAGLDELMPYHEGKAQVGADGTMVFSRYRLTDPRTFPVDNGGLDVRVGAPEPFRLLAVHTDQPIGWTRSWVKDMALVRQRATATVREGPTLVVGDFNATRDHPQLRAVLGSGLRDAAEEAGSGWQPTWPSRWRTSWLRPLITIDHVLTTPGYRALRTHTVEVPHTDHLALVAQLRRAKS
jgi:endonuclease/exonuclease/phosphatase family metal-dependent hydrolase